MKLEFACGLIALAMTYAGGTALETPPAPRASPSGQLAAPAELALRLEPMRPLSLQDGGDDAIEWPPPGVPDDLDPIYWWPTECPNDLWLVNWTDCILYFRTFLDCNGDGVVDEMNEHFVMPFDHATGTPWKEFIKTKPDCDILYWGLFDIIPVGGCDPIPYQDPYFGCAVHFL